MFIVLDGIDLSGKSSQIELLQQEFGSDENFLFLSDPGSTGLGLELRKILKEGVDEEQLDEKAEMLLFTASRAQLCNQVVLPAIEAGKTIICDRFLASTIAYQGFGRGFSIQDINELHRRFCGNVTPNITFIFTIPKSVYVERKNNVDRKNELNDRFEDQNYEFTARVVSGYDQILLRPSSLGVGETVQIDGTLSKEEINETIKSYLLENQIV